MIYLTKVVHCSECSTACLNAVCVKVQANVSFVEAINNIGMFLFPNLLSDIIKAGPSCDLTQQVSELFGGSCVPQVNQTKYPKLCSICNVSGIANCDSSTHPYRSYDGALR